MILALDTCLTACSAAILDGDRVLAARSEAMPRGHQERLAPLVRELAEEASGPFKTLPRIGVTVGPGSVTGLRVGMATAAAYGHALGVPVHGVCSTDAIGGRTTGEVLVVTDARRREVYWARYRDGVRVAGPGVAAAVDVDTDGVEAVAGSPEHAALFKLPRTGPERPTPPVWWQRSGTGPSRPRWCRCIYAAPTPRLWPSGGPSGG